MTPAGERGGRTRAVMETIRRRIETRALMAGDRLPSIRGLAAAAGVSPSTVVEAYDRLVAEGVAQARPGAGFYVAGGAPPPLPALAPRREREIDPLWMTRQALDAPLAGAQPGCGWLPADWAPLAALRRGLRAAARGEAARIVQYGPARGSAALRALLARRFAEEGLDIGPDRLILTPSTTRALDLVCRLLLRPGDRVLVDDPCYFNFLALLATHRVTIVGAPCGPSGPDPAAFEAIVAAERPRLYLTNSALQNPTGATLSPAAAHRILAVAAAHKVTIVEDDIFADFEPTPSPRLATLDGLARVVRIGGFSKTLSAALRCGYVAAREDWIDGLLDLQAATDFAGVDPVAADLVHAALADGGYRKHMAALRLRLVERRRDAGRRLEALGIGAWNAPRGGFQLWRELPDGLDAADVARHALREGLLLAPGDVFSIGRRAAGMMRFNVAQLDAPAVEGLARALQAARTARRPARAARDAG